MSANSTAVEIAPVKFGEKLGFCTFSTASNVVYQFKSIYYLLFLTNIVGIKVVHAGIIIAIGTVWDTALRTARRAVHLRCGAPCRGRLRSFLCLPTTTRATR